MLLHNKKFLMASQLPTSNINHNLILALMLNSNGRLKPHLRNLVEKTILKLNSRSV